MLDSDRFPAFSARAVHCPIAVETARTKERWAFTRALVHSVPAESMHFSSYSGRRGAGSAAVSRRVAIVSAKLERVHARANENHSNSGQRDRRAHARRPRSLIFIDASYEPLTEDVSVDTLSLLTTTYLLLKSLSLSTTAFGNTKLRRAAWSRYN